MRLCLDAHLPPAICGWLATTFGIEAESLIDLGLYRLPDAKAFERTRTAGVVIVTKDSDFADLVRRLGPPPQVLHLTFGNTSNSELRRILALALPRALELLAQGESLVEIGGPP